MCIIFIMLMKDEVLFILEWVVYYCLIGVNDLIVFFNDCIDGIDMMLEWLDDMGLVCYYINLFVYIECFKYYLQVICYVNIFLCLKKVDWIVSFDVDEFICVNVGQGWFEDLFNVVFDINVWSMLQLNFGYGGIWDYEDKLLGEQFNYCWYKIEFCYLNVNKCGIKMLIYWLFELREIYNYLFVFCKGGVDKVVMCGGSGQLIIDVDVIKDVKSLIVFWFGYDFVQFNYYVLWFVDSFLFKWLWGNVNYEIVGYGMQYWWWYDQNDWFDDGIVCWMFEVCVMWDELLKDLELGSLYCVVVDNVKVCIVDLKKMDEVCLLLNGIYCYIKCNLGIVLKY